MVGESLQPRPSGVWARMRHALVHSVLGLDDTPSRIAWGVFLGFLVGMTPTLGFQMLIYVALAAIFGANKISGLLPVWLSNPITAVPLYYTNWKIGHAIMTGKIESSQDNRESIERLLDNSTELSLFERLTDLDNWALAIQIVIDMGLELWVGSLVVGLVLGGIFFWVTLRAVPKYRIAKAHHRADHHD